MPTCATVLSRRILYHWMIRSGRGELGFVHEEKEWLSGNTIFVATGNAILRRCWKIARYRTVTIIRTKTYAKGFMRMSMRYSHVKSSAGRIGSAFRLHNSVASWHSRRRPSCAVQVINDRWVTYRPMSLPRCRGTAIVFRRHPTLLRTCRTQPHLLVQETIP